MTRPVRHVVRLVRRVLAYSMVVAFLGGLVLWVSWGSFAGPLIEANSRRQCANAGGQVWAATGAGGVFRWKTVNGLDSGAVFIREDYVVTEKGTLWEWTWNDKDAVARRVGDIQGVREIDRIGTEIGIALLDNGSIVAFDQGREKREVFDAEGVAGRLVGPGPYTSMATFSRDELYVVDSAGDVWRIPLDFGEDLKSRSVTAGEPRRIQGLTEISWISSGYPREAFDHSGDEVQVVYPWVMARRQDGTLIAWRDDPQFNDLDIADPMVLEGVEGVSATQAFYVSYKASDGHFTEYLGAAIDGFGQLKYIYIEDARTRLDDVGPAPVPLVGLGPKASPDGDTAAVIDADGRVWSFASAGGQGPVWVPLTDVSGVTGVTKTYLTFAVICGTP